MKLLKIVLLIVTIGFMHNSNAQFFKVLKDKTASAAKETVTRKVEHKTTEKTGEVMDTILDSDKKIKKSRDQKKKEETTNGEIYNENEYSSENANKNTATNKERSIKSAKDFEAGYDATFTDSFKNDAIGDFPVTWNTNSSGEVITFNNEDTRWLQLGVGEYTLDGITEIPDNCTFEFDLTVSDNFDFYSEGIQVNIIAVKNRKKDFMQWSHFGNGTDGVRLRLKPQNFEYVGETAIKTFMDNEVVIDNTKNNSIFTLKNNTVHIALWRQKKRLRVYLNNEKIWDIPRAFGDANYNAISFNTIIREEEHFYVSNLRLAVAGEDTRHPLLETGRFETNAILFDANKAVIKPSSYKVLDDLGKVLKENPSVRIKIIGHTDSDGSEAANLSLSEQRANAIKDYLNNHFSVAADRMQIVGKGESDPIGSNSTSEGKSKNRRVEFIKLN